MKFDFPHEDSRPQQMHVEMKTNKLRKLDKLPPRRTFSTKVDGIQPYLSQPDQADVTGIQHARGFTYLNINGGDSWGYWHPDENFEYIHNFKGEPVYKTGEFIPSYYIEKLKERRAILTGVRNYYVFRDPRCDVYYGGWHDPQSNLHEFYPVGTKAKLTDYLAQYGLPSQRIIHDWFCTFDPHNLIQFDAKNQYWNRFKPSKYMLSTRPTESKSEADFPEILAVIRHVLGATSESGSATVTAFLNWLAFVFQHRRAAGTAWILQGVPGTGKGVLANYIVKPLFGATNYTARRMEELEDKFNGYLEGCLICYVDEVQIGVSKRADIIMANLKNQITEPSITIRNMRQMAYEVPNFLSWIMSSNMTTPIQLDREDRRFNVGAYQTHPLRLSYPDTTALLAKIESQLIHFAVFLSSYAVDLDAVRIPVQSEARDDLIDNSKTSLDVVGEAITKGNIELLASFIGIDSDPMMMIKGESYKALIHEIITTNRNKLSRDELRLIFMYTVGDVPITPAKFSRFMNHRGIKIKKIRLGDRVVAGIEVNWVIPDELRQEIVTGKATSYLKAVPDDGLSGFQRSNR